MPPKGHTNVTVSVAFADATGARVHFDAYGSTKPAPTPPTKKCYITRNPLSEDSTVLFWPPPAVQYHLTVKTAPLGVVTISSEGWCDNCTYVNLTATEFVLVSPGVKYRFHYWDVDGANVSGNLIVVHTGANYTATAHYVLQYYLAVISPYSTPSGEGWYDKTTDAYANLATGTVDHGNETRRVFTHWSADASGNAITSDPIHMDGPHVATAHYQTACPPPAVGGSAVPITLDLGASSSLFLQIGLASVLSTIVAATIILIRRRKKTLRWKH